MSFHTRKAFVHIRTQIKIFLMKSKSFLTRIDSNTTDTFKALKRSKDIVKIVHVTSVVRP